MKASLILLTFVAFGACLLPSAFATQGVMYGYTIHVDFFAYSCSLSVTQVTLFDPSGIIVGSVSSPYGAEVAVTILTPDPMFTLTASANGLATLGSYYSWPVTGTASLTLGTAGNYWVTIRMN